MTLKNRVIRTAIGDHDTDAEGHLGSKDFEGYEHVAKGGVSTVITGYSWVCDYPMGGHAKMMGAYDDSFLPEYEKLAKMVHAHGCNIVQQLAHIGGASAIEVSGAWMNYKQDEPYFFDQTVTAANTVDIPVILVGGARGKETVEHILADTPIQYIGMARPFTADPNLMKEWNKEE